MAGVSTYEQARTSARQREEAGNARALVRAVAGRGEIGRASLRTHEYPQKSGEGRGDRPHCLDAVLISAQRVTAVEPRGSSPRSQRTGAHLMPVREFRDPELVRSARQWVSIRHWVSRLRRLMPRAAGALRPTGVVGQERASNEGGEFKHRSKIARDRRRRTNRPVLIERVGRSIGRYRKRVPKRRCVCSKIGRARERFGCTRCSQTTNSR